MSWVPRVVGPLFRALRFSRRATKVVSRVGRRGRIQAMKYPVRKPGKKLVKRHVKKKSVPQVGPMVYSRSGFRRYRKRRIYRRKKIANKIHTFCRYADKNTTYPDANGPNLIVEKGVDQNLSYTFKLDNVVNPQDFTNLYDQYRINKVQLMLEPLWDQAGNGSGLNQNRRIRVVHDYNDANPLTQEDDYLEYSNCKSYFPWSKRGIKITLYPKIANIVENAGGAATAFTTMNSNRVWLNIADDEVPHFGLKIFVPGSMAPVDLQMFTVRAKFWLSMKNSK